MQWMNEYKYIFTCNESMNESMNEWINAWYNELMKYPLFNYNYLNNYNLNKKYSSSQLIRK